MNIQTVCFDLTEMSPLLMNNPKLVLGKEKTLKSRSHLQTPLEEATLRLYQLESGQLYVPSAAVRKCTISAGVGYKAQGRRSLANVIKGSLISVTDSRTGDNEHIGLYTLDTDEPLFDWDIDTRRAVVGSGAAIMRSRPRVTNWQLHVTLTYDAAHLPAQTFYEALERGGIMIGLLDYRPEKSGTFGRFEIAKVDCPGIA